MAVHEGFGWSEAGVEVAGARVGVTTAWVRGPVGDDDALDALYDELAGRLRRRGHVLVHEKAFGLGALAPTVDGTRRRAFARAGLGEPVPTTWLEGRPCVGGRFAGLQAWSVEAADGVQLQPLRGDVGAGWLVTTQAGRLLFVGGVTGAPGPTTDVPAELGQMFERARGLLQGQGFTFRDVARTWLFAGRLLDLYDDLNRVRSAFFRGQGLIDGPLPVYLPASTGIQGAHPSGAACVLDLLAVQASATDAAPTPLRSARQDAAFQYGSAFSRGMRLGAAEHPLVLVSGTASIALDGRSLYAGDPQGQIAETLLDVAAVLRSGATTFGDVVSTIRYHKDPQTFRTYSEMKELGLVPDLPGIDVLADVCRSELLFELEAVATR